MRNIPGLHWRQPTTAMTVLLTTGLLLLFPSSTKAQLNFASLGNWGSGSTSEYANAKTVKEFAHTKKLSFIVSPGSNFADGVTDLDDPVWRTAFEDPFTSPALNFPFFNVLGADDWTKNVTAQILRSNHTYHKGADEFNMTCPVWTMPNSWYYYSLHFTDNTEKTCIYGNSESSIGLLFIDTHILSPRFAHQEITKKQWDFIKQTLSIFSQIFDWVIVVGDKAIYSSGQSKGDAYLADTLRQVLKEYNVDVYLSGYDRDMEVIEDGDLIHVSCGTGSGSDLLARVKAENSVLYFSRLGFCHHQVTVKNFTTHFIDGTTGTVLGTHTKPRQPKKRAVFNRFQLYSQLPEIKYVPLPDITSIHVNEKDLFLRICGTFGLAVLGFIAMMFATAMATRLSKHQSSSPHAPKPSPQWQR